MANLEDQRRYAEAAGVVVHQDDLTAPEHVPQPRRENTLEKDEQSQFANYCLRHKYPAVWHKMNTASTATPGTPDFIMAVNGVTLWIEFKRPGFRLSPDQEMFRILLEAQNVFLHIVYSAQQAMDLVKAYAHDGNGCLPQQNLHPRDPTSVG